MSAHGHPGVMGMRRWPAEGLRPGMSMDSARPTYEADHASCSGDGSDESYAGVPLSMEHKSGCKQWPPYRHNVQQDAAEEADVGREGDDEPQPLTRDIKKGALGTSLPERAVPRAAFSAFRPPPGPARVSAEKKHPPLACRPLSI